MANTRLPFLFLVSALLSACSLPTISGTAGYGQFSFSGKAGYTLASSPSNLRNDIRSSLGFDDPEPFPYVHGEAGVGPFLVTASGFQLSTSGSGTLEAQFGSIPVGTAVHADMDVTSLRGSLYFFDLFDIVPLPFVSLKPGIGVDYFDVSLKAEALSGAVKEDFTQKAPIPILAARAGVNLGIVEAVLEGGGIKIDYQDEIDGTFLDLEGLLKVHPMSNLTLFAGYRYINVDGDGKDGNNRYDVGLVLQGWMVGGGLKF